jgi:hypothetical protein
MAWDDDAYYETELEIPSGRYGKLIAIPGGPGPSGPPGPQGPAGADSTVPGPQGEPGAGASTWDEVSDKPEGVPGGFPVLDGDGNVPAENLPDVYAATIVDSTEVGRAVVVAADEKAARTAIGPGGVDFIGVPTPEQFGGSSWVRKPGGGFEYKTDNNATYWALAGDIAVCDVRLYDFTVMLPAAPADGSQVTVKRTDKGEIYALTVKTQGADVFEHGPQTFRLRLPSQTVTFQYDAGVWRALDLSVALYRLALLQSPAEAVISRMAVPPTDARKQVITGLVNDLQVCGVWDKLDALFVFAAHDHQAALLNWKTSVVEDAVAVNAPVFTPDRGFTGDGATTYLDTNTQPSSYVRYKASDATLGVYTRTPVSLNRADIAMGSHAAVTPAAGTNIVVRVNSTNFFNGANGLDYSGLFAASRLPGADTGFVYKDGQPAGSGAQSAGIVPGTPAQFLRNGLTNYSTREVSAGFWGAGLTATEHADLNTALTIYLTAIGAAV